MPTLRWAAAFGALWVGLTIAQELGAPQFAAGLAVTIAVSTLIVEGPNALSELNKIIS